MTEEKVSDCLTLRWIVEFSLTDPLLYHSSSTILGIYKSEEKAKQHANWLNADDPKKAEHIRVYKVVYEE